MKIKVCGMREADNIRTVEQLGINYMGFIFWPKSSRYVASLPDYLPTQCKRVGVFVDSSLNDVLQHCTDFHLDVIQLHGNESPSYLEKLRKLLIDSNMPATIMKAVSVSSREDIMTYRNYDGLVEAFLFDTKCSTVGGSGRQFDWSVLSSYDGELPFLLSGGIGPDDADLVHNFQHPRMMGIDLNSRFESAPAQKDITKLKHFLQAL